MYELLEDNDIKINPADYLWLALKFAYKYKPKNSYEEIKDTEVYSIACEELIRAASLYKANRGDFTRFAWRSMMNGFLQFIRSQKRMKRSANFARLNDHDWHNIPDRNEKDSIKEMLPLILRDTAKDSQQDKEDLQLVIDHYINGKQINVLADILKVTRVTVHSRIQRCFNKIKRKFNDMKGD